MNWVFDGSVSPYLRPYTTGTEAGGQTVPGFDSRFLLGDLSVSNLTSVLKIGAWRYGVSAGTGRPGVSIL